MSKTVSFCKVLTAALVLATSTVFAATWYISPTGSDSNFGTTTNTALASIMEAQTKASSGDIVYIMAGTYYLPNNTNSVPSNPYAAVNLINKNGISYEAMPGTRPVFNFSAVVPLGLRVVAFWVTATGVTFQGFDVVGITENITNVNNQSVGFAIWGCKNCTWNQVNVHDADCVGFYAEKAAANNLIYRCDSYNNAGIDSFSYGNADGFGCHPSAGGTNNIFRECRAWNNSDDGYDCINASETVTWDHCWSYLNGNNGGNGNGFKVGGWASTPQNQIPNPVPTHIVLNCLSAKNGSHGFYANHQPAGPGTPTGWTNNTAYDNSGADFDMLQRTPPDFTTNIDQTDSNDIPGTNEVMHYNLAYAGYSVTGDYNLTGSPLVTSNSWTLSPAPATGDFLSTTYTQMTNARAADGSLPVITFMHLVNGDHLTGLGCFVVPPAPAGLTATASNTQVTLIWPVSTGATGYNLKRSIINGSGYSNIASDVTATNYTDAGLTNGKTYYYIVTALNPGDESTNSVQASATTIPPAPETLTASATNAQVTLNWTASAGATSYNVKRSTNNGGPYVTNASPTTTNYVDTGLANGTTYYYVVSAVNAAGQSANSAQASATTIPSAPAELIATGGNAQVSLSWTAATGAIGYNVKSATVSGGPYTTIASGVTTMTYTNIGLANGTTCYYVVSAMNSTGESTNSLEASAQPMSSSTTTSLNVLNAVTYGTPMTFTATVSPAPTTGDTVIFKDGSIILGTGTTGGGGAASFTTTNTQLSAGSHPITAAFGGDANYLGSTSGISNQAVNTASVTPVVTLNSRPYDGTSAPATIATESLTGVIGSDDVNLGNSGIVAAFTNQNAGSYTVNITGLSLSGTTAENYSLTSTATTATGVITPASSITTITSSTNPAPYEGDVTFSATVGGVDTPTGTVEFLTNGVFFDSEALSGGAATSTDTTLLAPGTNIITAAYSGDGNYQGSTNTLGQVMTVAQFKAVNKGGGGLELGGSGGLPGGIYYVLVSTNMVAPPSDWTPVLTNQFDANGNFNFTNGMNTNIPQGYFIIRVP